MSIHPELTSISETTQGPLRRVYHPSGKPTQWKDKKNRLHRDDGPAEIYPDGTEVWCHHGLLHRSDGPAMCFPNGVKRWFYHGQRFETFAEWLDHVAQSPEERSWLTLKWSQSS